MSVRQARNEVIDVGRFNDRETLEYVDNLIAAVRDECAEAHTKALTELQQANNCAADFVRAQERARVLAEFRELAEEWQAPCDDHDCREVTCSTFNAAGNRLANLIQSIETPNQKP